MMNDGIRYYTFHSGMFLKWSHTDVLATETVLFFYWWLKTRIAKTSHHSWWRWLEMSPGCVCLLNRYGVTMYDGLEGLSHFTGWVFKSVLGANGGTWQHFEPSCKDLLQFSHKSIRKVGNWCWVIRPGRQVDTPIHPDGVRWGWGQS